MAMRRGIERRRREREERRRGEAKEAGVVLEARASKRGRGAARGRGRRERGSVGDPAVGRFKRGLLTLSERDVAQIRGKRGGRGVGRRR
jgi:hypothetical protein